MRSCCTCHYLIEYGWFRYLSPDPSNKIIEDAGDSLTLTQYWAIKDQANKEFEELLKSQETMQADIDSIISQAKKNVR